MTSTHRTYKAFWNEGSYGVIEKPKVEESCRDRLLDLLRPRLSLHGILAEPEGHMAVDKHCDVVIAHPTSGTVVIEIKRHQHGEVWSASSTQLDRLYTRGPDANGYGIYLVLWRGTQKSAGPPTPPAGVVMPPPAEMEAALNNLVPEKDPRRIRGIVIDVTRRES